MAVIRGPIGDERAGLLAGTFLICLSLLAFEISTVRTINFAIGPSFIFVAIALAMLGLTAAGSILSAFNLEAASARRSLVLTLLCAAIGGLIVLSNVLIVDTKAAFNATLAEGGTEGGLGKVVALLLTEGVLASVKIGLFISLPYFLFGALLSYLFATSRSQDYAGLYAADLIGAAVGCVLIVIVMETTSYAFSVTAPAVVAMLAAAAFATGAARILKLIAAVLALGLAILPAFDGFRTLVEPAADPHHLMRDYGRKENVAETWRGWNSFTRVGAIEWTDGTGDRATLALANGDGMAYLWPYRTDRAAPLTHKPAIPALLLDPAEDVLVLFAGAGADMMSLREHGARNVTGVELNANMLAAGLALGDYDLAQFLATDGIDLEIAEARSFLESDSSLYDTILVSWSGATAVYYLGALSGTTQYIFTHEGLTSILDHLKPDGYAVVLQVNKVKVLASLRRYMADRGLSEPERAAIVLYRDGHVNGWDNAWDDNPLLIKLDGWSDGEVDRIVANAAGYGLKVAYAPGRPVNPDYTVYERVLNAPDAQAVLDDLRAQTGLRFSVVTDDQPFQFDLFAPERYLSADFWFGFSEGHLDQAEVFHLVRVMLTMLLAITAFFLALAPLVVKRGNTPRARSLGFLFYFSCLGAGFMVLEIAIIQRLGLLFGNPGLTIALVLSAIILFTGLGSLISNRSFRAGLNFHLVAAGVIAYAALAGFFLEDLVHAILGWPLLGKALAAFAVTAPGAILMGHLFPQGIALAGREDKALVPWAWAINGAMGATVAGIAPLVAQAVGFQILFLIGALLYAGVLVIPAFRGGRRSDLPEPVAATG